MRTRVRTDLKDTDAAGYRWTDTVLDRHIDHAVREFSHASPREMVETKATVADSREIDISSLTDRVQAYAAEYPAGEFPPRYQRFSIYSDTLTLLGVTIPDGSNAYIYYGKLHTLISKDAWVASTAYSLGDYVLPTTPNGYYYKCTTAGTSDSSEPTWPATIGDTVNDNTAVWTCEAVTSTIPSQHEDLIVIGAAAFALTEYAAYAIDRISTGGDQTAQRFRIRGEELYRHFKKELKRLKSRLRSKSLYSPATAPLSQSTDWGP